jgi:hypothetical protein
MHRIIILLFLLFTTTVKAQDAIIKTIVETYYVSDSKDATDTLGGGIEAGSKTYRIYVQLPKGYKLSAIYGDANHALKISSTANFFNNKDRGKTFGKDIIKTNLTNNTVALDSWITLGQTTTAKNGLTYFGILKSQDKDSSFIGGNFNDGGSAGIAGGLLTNNDPMAGIPITKADGMDTMLTIPTNWFNTGFIDAISGNDSSIFGSLKPGKEFISNNAILQNSGISGVNPDSNQILIAQLTSKGDISFELNLEVLSPDGSSVKYTAVKSTDSLAVKYSGWLKYPYLCGCQDPDYFEYSSDYVCSDQTSCKTLITLGCMDPNACNFNPKANYNIQSLCCYPGLCADRDISLVCPELKMQKMLKMNVYPNPSDNQITIETTLTNDDESRYIIYNSFGNKEIDKSLGKVSGTIIQELNVSGLKQGIYLIRWFNGNYVISKSFMKL